MRQKNKKVFVIGGGPAGMTAAAFAAKCGCDVTLVDKNEKLGKKLFITGKGRCNVTNACDIEDFFGNIAHNRSFCYSAVYSFTQDNTRSLIEENGTPLKVERGERVFPVSDKSSDIIKAFEHLLKVSGVDVMLRSQLNDIYVADKRVTGVKVNGKPFECDSVILALGGASYKSTGSDGAWKKLIEGLGHRVEEFSPALVPLVTDDKVIKSLQGLSLKNVMLNATIGGKRLYSELGEMLFTHFGASGPLVLTLSSLLTRNCFNDLNVYVDLKPGLNDEQLDARLLRDFKEFSNKEIKNALVKLLPQRLISAVLHYAEIDEMTIVNQLTAEMRQRLLFVLKHFPIKIIGFGDINEAIITRGGVSTKEIDPSTMQSKLIGGLYFCGEMVDIDALTGGFNIQLAVSTGYSAGISQGDI